MPLDQTRGTGVVVAKLAVCYSTTVRFDDSYSTLLLLEKTSPRKNYKTQEICQNNMKLGFGST